MKNFMQYIVVICISFTFSSVFYILFSTFSIFPSLDEQMLVNMLFISIGITILMMVTHSLPIQSLFLVRILEMSVLIIVLLAAGKFFRVFPLNLYNTSFVLVTGLLTYVVVLLVTFVGDVMSANKINTTLQMRKMEHFHE